MIKNLLFSTVLALSVVTSYAKDFNLPEKKAVVSVTIPDSWNPEEIDNGVHAESPDEGVYIAIESAKSEKGMDAIIESTFAMLEEHKVVLTKSSKKTNKFKVAGEDAEEMVFAGKEDDTEVTVSITFVTIGTRVFVITYWADNDKAEKHSATIGKIVKSIKTL